MIFLLWRQTVCTIYKIAKRAHGIILCPFPRAGFLQIPRLRHAERISIIFDYTVDSRYLEPSREVKKTSSYRELGENSWKQKKQFFSSTV